MARIMLVEDNVIYRELVRELCERDGHAVLEASRAEEALEQLKNYGQTDLYHRRHTIDLFIVDFNMDRMNGFEFIQAVRGREGLREVPMIMISSTSKDLTELLRMRGVAFLRKPVSNAAVMECVRRMLAAGSAAPAEGEAAPPPPPAKEIQPMIPVGEALKRPLDRAMTPPPLTVRRPDPPTPPPPPLTNGMQDPLAEGPLEVPDDGIRNHIAQSAGITELLGRRGDAGPASSASLESASSPVAELLDKILDSAVAQRASDIHLEPQTGALEVRVRVDGVLQTLIRLPSTVTENLTARIKIVCSLNITEKRLPQDGQFSRKDGAGRATKFRVSTLPAVGGEKVVMRVLPAVDRRAGLDSIGFSVDELALVQQVLRSPNGVLLVTGPTGSGKTSTLYTMLDTLNSRERNIVTVEDPVEYQLPGITQVQVNPDIGYTFERVLRSFLRQDPDVMLVGEIRDAETAEIALKAAVTGHLVLTTLHTNDAVGAVHRLQSMGIAPYLISAAARMVIAQRLVRVLCPQCKVSGRLAADQACLIAPEEAAALPQVWHPTGCSACRGVGYRGRRVVLELLPILSVEMRAAIAKSASPDEMKELARVEGMVTMRSNALKLVAHGVTSLDEALSALLV